MIKGFLVTKYFFLLKLSLTAQTLDGVTFMSEKALFLLLLSLSLSNDALTFQKKEDAGVLDLCIRPATTQVGTQ